jgi:hypothetical protein
MSLNYCSRKKVEYVNKCNLLLLLLWLLLYPHSVQYWISFLHLPGCPRRTNVDTYTQIYTVSYPTRLIPSYYHLVVCPLHWWISSRSIALDWLISDSSPWILRLCEEMEVMSRFGVENRGRGGGGGVGEQTINGWVKKILEFKFFFAAKRASQVHNHFAFRLTIETKPDRTCAGKMYSQRRWKRSKSSETRHHVH